MTAPYLVLNDLSYQLPDGSPLLTELRAHFDGRTSAIVGRNGVGKTQLAKILAGRVKPTSGSFQCSGPVYYLAQQVRLPPNTTVADLAGVRPVLEALNRIAKGSCAEEDFAAVADNWDMPQRLQYQLERQQLGHLHANSPASTLSGGEAMRLSLIAALLCKTDFLILDEPSNHLDTSSRHLLIKQLQQWPRGLIVISHDRLLLESVERIFELTPRSLSSYGGNYSFYTQEKALQQVATQRNLDSLEHSLRRQSQLAAQQRERQARRQANGRRHAKHANQAKILLDGQKARSEASAAALRKKHKEAHEQRKQQLNQAKQQITNAVAIHLQPISPNKTKKSYVAELKAVTLPRVSGPNHEINLQLSSSQRLGIVGANGCGKSTLLKLLAGQIAPLSGSCKSTTNSAYLDQTLSNLDPHGTTLEQLKQAQPTASEADLRMRLAQLGLDSQKIHRPINSLSGGEGIKAALACLLYAEPPPQLLLLDEPDNHLDLPSLDALERLLCSYRGCLVVVSHDSHFLSRLSLSHRLIATPSGWQLKLF